MSTSGTFVTRSSTAQLATIAGPLLAAAAISLDVATWIELDVASLYGLPLVVCAVTHSRRLLWTLMVVLSAATFAVYLIQAPTGVFTLYEPFLVNRLLDALSLLLTTGVLDLWMKSAATNEAQSRLLRAQNSSLTSINSKLACREALIAQQNKELERRRAEAEEASVRKTKILAFVSHDIRGSANVINMMAHVIARTAESRVPDKKTAQVAQRLQVAASSLVAMVSDILDIAQFDSGHISLRATVFSGNSLLKAKCDELVALAQTKGLTLSVDLPPQTVFMRTDAVKLGRVVSNLVVNAIKFSTGGKVAVQMTLDVHRAVLISVRDTGPGIAPENIDGIFNEFQQLGEAVNGGAAWGLGLAICRRLVTFLGGTITVESQLKNGSEFTIRLPWACVAHISGNTSHRDCSLVSIPIWIRSEAAQQVINERPDLR